MRNMVVVISDLHFEEERGDVIGDFADPKTIRFNRNVPASAFEDMISDIASMAMSNGVNCVEFVLAGDVFDLHRTQLWFAPGETLRPYVDCAEVAPAGPLEKKVLSILEAIAAEPEVSRSLAAFNRLASGQYLDTSAAQTGPQEFKAQITLHYIPGNHDRLANATPTIRAKVRSLLGMPVSDAKFPHQLRFQDPPLLVRHGHEYDATNFPIDLGNKPIDEELPDGLYDKPTFGDFVTVMIASRLPIYFREHYGDQAILNDQVLAAIYYRILEFDDVRPQSVVLDFFFNTQRPKNLEGQFPSVETWQRHIWSLITPILLTLLDEIAADTYFRDWLRRFGAILPLIFFKSRIWRLTGLPFWISRLVGVGLDRESGSGGPQSDAAHERALETGATFIVAGHTHKPQVAHLFTAAGDKKYFTDTGTWRNAILAAGDKNSYGRVNATTYVAFYGKELDVAANNKAHHGFEYWTGYDQSWPVSGADG